MKRETRQHVTVRIAPDLVRLVEKEQNKLERRTGIRPSRSQVIEKFLSIGLNGK
ncbi:TPA: hypothetical protein ACM36I_001269 [Escherichia coli]|uniref:hypothetical protein n=1 Tax=Enterobacteriaceae TaxID=543 RepID=UPI00039000DC|nr:MULTISPECIES: hypothetical protein [Enterobacteriaceae]EKW7172005.1 hypothetical protein [Enterobacter hormaechei]MCQ8844967.1 hypothetical protein [Klebsiella sp. KJ_S1]EHK4145027.1 hypothetical protein [Escherichia coli]EHK5509941.1 hypothetical protein [Escherichia coli]EHK7394387.1 hypothetical protein [Escherichia coli]